MVLLCKTSGESWRELKKFDNIFLLPVVAVCITDSLLEDPNDYSESP